MAGSRKRTGGTSKQAKGARRTAAPAAEVTVVRAHGAVVSEPRPVDVAEVAGAARRGVRAGRAGAAAAPSDETAVLLAALGAAELGASHEITISPAPAARGRRSAAAAAAPSVELAVQVAPTESAVVLVEQDGEYSWHFPEPAPAPRAGAARRGARKSASASTATAAAPTTLTIRIDLAPANPAKARTRGAAARQGIGIGKLLSKAKGFVLKFVARAAVGTTLKFLERNVRKGLIVMDGDDPTQWRRISHIDDLGIAEKPEPMKVLLWLHGTFSSTAGSFGALAGTPDGRLLLEQARGRYDAVLGFDHATLSESPQENAVDLVERLGRFRRPMQVDAVTFSRGGLVFRSLVEQLIPSSATKPDLRQAVFVGVPNGGTLLAEPDNWHALVDLYTNLAVAAFRLVQLLPAAAPAAHILSEIVSGLGAFVKYLADVTVTDRAVPGLAAMEPDGAFVKALNETGAGQPIPDSCRYLAITSSFDAKAARDAGAPVGLAGSLIGKLADGLIDRLMRESNDLVVNTGSMTRIDPAAGDFIDASLDFAESPTVYHTVYFAQASVAQMLRGWLIDESAREGLAERPGLLEVRPSARSPFTRVRYHQGDGRRPAPIPVTAAPTRAGARKRSAKKATPLPAAPDVAAAESAAEAQVTKLFGVRSAAPVPASLAADAAAAAAAPRARAYAPALAPERVQASAIAPERTVRVVSFEQMHRKIPVFGTRTVIELDSADNLVAARAKLGQVSDVSAVPSLTPEKALRKLFAATAIKRDAARVVSARVAKEPPALTFFHDRAADQWHLAYLFGDIPAVPASWKEKGTGRVGVAKSKAKARRFHGAAASPRERAPRLDYLVDAHDGAVVYYYGISPAVAKTTRRAAAAPVEEMILVFGQGRDDEGKLQQIGVRKHAEGFELVDPLRNIATFDFRMRDIDVGRPPRAPIASKDARARFDVSPAAVSAHVNVSKVFQFYNEVLVRRGVDDKGTRLENLVNVISPADEPPPAWGNAVWWKNKMWYGQVEEADGKLRSLARHLDIIGHELAHGVTEHTCGLVYRDEAGALNESFSDIYGVIIKNRVRGAEVYANPDKWDWDVGTGLGENGKPLRNMARPRLTGDPEHVRQMTDFDPRDLELDFGGVHTFSSIHNKAAHNLLTSRTGKSKNAPLVFAPDEAALLYYFTLQRLDKVATFEDVLETLLDVVRTVHPDPAVQQPKLDAVRKAYAAVGVPRA